MELNTLTSVSPIDGRYHKNTRKLSAYFSEMALMKYRVKVEVLYLIALATETKIKEIRKLTPLEKNKLEKLYINFSLADATAIKEIEKTTNHDVKAVEYFIKEKFKKSSLQPVLEFVHFALTSEDINNLAYSLMLRDAVKNVYIPLTEQLLNKIKNLAKQNNNVSLLSLTHGQPATSTTLGKEFAVVAARIKRQLDILKKIKLMGKLNGATGNWAAHSVAYPQVNWINFSRKFVSSLGLEINLLTTQIEPHDSLCEVYDAIRRINNIVKDFDRDMWMYISRKIFKQQNKSGEIGSSAMPHKINPIFFENSEGNIGLANALLVFFSNKLPISRMQRDLTDSTVLRNQGTALAYCIIAYENTLKALERVATNKQTCQKELDEHWEVLAEAIQTVLRKLNYPKPYEKLKELTRGQKINQKVIHEFISGLDIDKKEKEKLLNLTPANYTGYSSKLANLL
ncbi:MAG: adenylosuccinate lyase [Patescibacteria group bacterium]